MIRSDKFQQQLVEIYPQCLARRQSDPVLDEIWCDYEELLMVSGQSETDANQNDDALQKDLNAAIHALQEEIRVRLGNSSH